MRITVFIADDHTLLREGLRLLFAAYANIHVVGDASSGRETVRQVLQLQPQIVLMDISMPDMNGIEATRQLKERCPAAKVIILSMHATIEHYYQAIHAGARGYVLKESAAEEVAQAVRTVHVGRQFISARIADDFRALASDDSPIERLSRREREVLQLVAEGRCCADIAGLLKLSPKSVETYRSRLMQKLGMRGTPDLVKFAIRNGIASLD